MKKSNIKAVSGHYEYGVHQHFNKPYSYFSMVRHPIDRVISLYYYLSTNPYYVGYESMKKMTFEEFITKSAQAKNHQTLFFTGNYTFDIELAKKNLETHFPIVGITEMFNESIYLMKKRFDWKKINYKKINITQNRPSLQDIPKNLIELIEKNNHLDMELYRYAKARLTKQLEMLSPADWNEIEKIKKASRT
jgi:hypothetical protein